MIYAIACGLVWALNVFFGYVLYVVIERWIKEIEYEREGYV